MAASQSIFGWTTQVMVRRSQMRTTPRILLLLNIQLVQTFSDVDGIVKMGITAKYCDTFQQQSLAFD
jgi:hypothetical protein